jgi:hypothetical protein
MLVAFSRWLLNQFELSVIAACKPRFYITNLAELDQPMSHVLSWIRRPKRVAYDPYRTVIGFREGNHVVYATGVRTIDMRKPTPFHRQTTQD